MRKLFFNILPVLILILMVSAGYGSDPKNSHREVNPYKVVRIEDYSLGIPLNGEYEKINPQYTFIPALKDHHFDRSFTHDLSSNDFYGSVQFTPIGGASIFDQQSNACPVQIWQDPSSPQFIHAVYMESPMEDLNPFNLRRTRYYFSSNYGNTWEFRAELPVNTRSGYGAITGMSDGSILIANHFISGPNINRTFIHQEVFPQLGSFNRLDPGLGQTRQVEWPRIVAGNNILDPVKFSVLSSSNIQGTIDSAFFNYCTGMVNNGQFGQWKFFRSRNDECYSIARSESGKIGVAFINNEDRFPSDRGDVFFIESSDMGQNYTSPLKIFDADFTSPNADSLGGFRGISIVYSNNQPRVVFETVFQDMAGGFFPGIASNIRYWTPSLPGNNPDKSIIAIDSLDLPFYPHQGVNDLLTGICRPVIGKSDDGSALFIAFMAADSVYGGSHTPTTFHNIYLTASVNNGFEWKAPVKLNSTNPRKDWTYVSISQTNDQNSSNYFVNLSMQSDNIPGSYPSGPANGKSLAQQIFARVSINKPLLVNPVTNEIPEKFFLYQNYPNPFNPETIIKFSIPIKGEATLKVFDINGRGVRTFFEKRNFSPGVYNVEFNSGQLNSGVYFYTLELNGQIETRKMVLLK